MSAVSSQLTDVRPDTEPVPIVEAMFTFDDFMALITEEQKADLLNGAIYMASPQSLVHSGLFRFLYCLLVGYVEQKRLGMVFGDKDAFRLSDHYCPEPDIAFVRAERLTNVRDEDTHFDGPPDVAVEIVSRDSRDRDYDLKYRAYLTAGVREYWLVDLGMNRVQFLRLRDGRYEIVPLEGNRIFRSSVISGFWLDVEWLVHRPLPQVQETLKRVLASA